MIIEKDNRTWVVELVMDSDKCPHLYYPANLHACHIREDRGDEDTHCTLELCPFRTGLTANISREPRGSAPGAA